MTKSVLTGVGVVVMFVVIMAGLAGAYELTAPLAVAWLFLFVVFAILFAGFGGFKPFFAADETAMDSQLVSDHLAKDSSKRRLISVGAEVDEAQSLFDEREPISSENVEARTVRFDASESPSDVDLIPPRAPLFGEALSDRLESERRDATGSDELESTGIEWADDAPVDDGVEDEDLVDEDLVDDAADETETQALGIVVEENPDWVADGESAEEEVVEVLDVEVVDDEVVDSEVVGDEILDEAVVHEEAIEAELLDEAEVEEADPDDGTTDEVAYDDVEVEDEADLEGTEAEDIEAEDIETEDAAEDADEDVLDADEVLEVEEVLDVVEVEAVAADEESVDAAEVDLEDIDAEKLAAALDSIAPVDPADSTVEVDYVSEPIVTASTGLSVGSGTELPVVVQTPAPLELHKYSSSEIMAVVKTQESHLVDTLIDEGVLSTEGPLTDKDIRTMVFVAVSSTELIDVLTEGQQEAVALNGGGNHALESGS